MARNRGFLLAGQLGAAALAIAAVAISATAGRTSPAARHGRQASDLNARGVAAYHSGDYPRASGLFEQALDLDPENTPVKANLALSLYAQAVALATRNGAVAYDDRALGLMQTACTLAPERAEIHAGLGEILFLGGRNDDAERELTTAVELAPGDAQSQFLLGEIAHLRGQVDEALEHWEEAARLAPENEHIAARLAQARKESEVEGRFTRRELAHFSLRFDSGVTAARSGGDEILLLLEDAYRQVGHELGLWPEEPISVVVYRDDDFRSITGLHGWASGVYDGRIRLPDGVLSQGAAAERQLVFHEYTHAAIFDIARGHVPVWLNEGLAQLMSGEWEAKDDRFLEGAQAAGALLPLSSLEGSIVEETDPGRVRVIYAESYAAARYLTERFGRATTTEALRALGSGKSMSRVLSEVYALDYDELDREVSRRISWGEYRN